MWSDEGGMLCDGVFEASAFVWAVPPLSCLYRTTLRRLTCITR